MAMAMSATTFGIAPLVISYNFTLLDTHGNMIFSGDVLSDNGSKITDRGVVYSDTNALPTLLDRKQSYGNGTGTGTMNIIIANLIICKKYYARTFATNSFGTAYAEVLSAIA